MRMNSLDVFLVDQGLILSLLTAVTLESLLVLSGCRVDSHEKESVFIVLLYEFEGSRGVCLNILLYLLNRLSVLLLMHYIPFLLKRHLVFELQRYLTLRLKPLPCLSVLRLPILRRHRTLYIT